LVLFVFVVMLLNLGPGSERAEVPWLRPRYWLGPGLLAGALLMQLLASLWMLDAPAGGAEVGPKAVGILLFGPYLLAVELGSMLLLAGLVSAFHLGRTQPARGTGE
jgi:NADH-quinone oxidoreductase subunit J